MCLRYRDGAANCAYPRSAVGTLEGPARQGAVPNRVAVRLATWQMHRRLWSLYEKMLTLRVDAVRKVKGDFDPLYAVLNDDQKKVADELLASPMSIM